MSFKLKIDPELVSELCQDTEYDISIDWSKVECFLVSQDGIDVFYSVEEAESKLAEILFKDHVTTAPTITKAYF